MQSFITEVCWNEKRWKCEKIEKNEQKTKVWQEKVLRNFKTEIRCKNTPNLFILSCYLCLNVYQAFQAENSRRKWRKFNKNSPFSWKTHKSSPHLFRVDVLASLSYTLQNISKLEIQKRKKKLVLELQRRSRKKRCSHAIVIEMHFGLRFFSFSSRTQTWIYFFAKRRPGCHKAVYLCAILTN